MASKLVYTSAPKGLKEGSFGFCTVACSRNLSERTIAALEAFSGYRRLFVDAERAAQNPVAYSHVLLDDGESTLRVLSRIADAGLDYSNRSNKIASHLALEPTELGEAGPAAFFEDSELFEKRWEGSPQFFDAPFVLPQVKSRTCSLEEWKKTTGDPGWAGLLASTVYTDRPVVLIARPDHNVLALYQEALSLLSPALRWRATFSTYYAKTPPGVQCQWKATMFGSRESQTMRALPFALVLDLTSPLSSSRPESVDSSPHAIRLINVARGVANKQADASKVKAPPILDVFADLNKIEAASQNQETSAQKTANKGAVASNASFVDSAKKMFDYGRKLPKICFKANAEERMRRRVFGVAFVGVFALSALIYIGADLIGGVGKKTQNVQEEVQSEKNPQIDDAQADVLSESKEIDYSETSNVDDSSLESSEETIDDPFTYDENKTKERSKEDKTSASASKETSDAAQVDSTTKENETKGDKTSVSLSKENSDDLSIDSTTEKNEAKGEKTIDGTDLSDDLLHSPLLPANRRPEFLTSEEYQTTVDFQKLVADRRLTVDFGVFQRGTNKGDQTLSEELDGDSQALFSDALELCKKFKGKLEITCDLSADQNNERKWFNSKQRTNKQEFDFANIKPSNSAKVVFKTTDATKDEQNGSLSLELDSQGKLAFHMSDEKTRNYFLRSCRLKWKITLPDPNGTEKDFVAETQYAQALRPCEFDLLNDPKIVASIIKLSNDGLLPLAVPSALSSYDPARNAKHNPALLVLLNPDAAPSAFDVESQMDDKKKSIVFVFKLKAEQVDALKIRFTRNSQVVRSEAVFDRETLNETLEDYFSRRSFPIFPYSESQSSQNNLQNALREVEFVLNRRLKFDFYLVATTGKEQNDQNKYVFLGSANITPKDIDQKEK